MVKKKRNHKKTSGFWVYIISLFIVLTLITWFIIDNLIQFGLNFFGFSFYFAALILVFLIPYIVWWVYHVLTSPQELLDKEWQSKKQTEQTKQSTPPPTIECPYCHSTDTQKISGMSRAGSIVVWGIFSKKLGKQWHCNKCGSDF